MKFKNIELKHIGNLQGSAKNPFLQILILSSTTFDVIVLYCFHKDLKSFYLEQGFVPHWFCLHTFPYIKLHEDIVLGSLIYFFFHMNHTSYPKCIICNRI